jgi:hypothetical protein
MQPWSLWFPSNASFFVQFSTERFSGRITPIVEMDYAVFRQPAGALAQDRNLRRHP